MQNSREGDISLSTIEAMKAMASDKDRASALVQDDTCLGGLIVVLSNSDASIVCTALETLYKLAEWPEHRNHMRNFIGMTDQLQSLMTRFSGTIQELALCVQKLLESSGQANTQKRSQAHHHPHSEPLKDTSNQNKQYMNVDNQQRQKPKRRNSFFVGGGIGNNKIVILHIRGLHDRDDMDQCRNSLLTVKGVISITFDFHKKRAILRTRPDLQPELLANAVARSMTMSAEQVVKDEAGNEVFVSFKANAAKLNKENEDMPDYPDDDSPIKGDKNMARIGDPSPRKPMGGFLKSVGSFLSNTLYW